MKEPQIIYATGKVNLFVVIAFFLILIANAILIFQDIQFRQDMQKKLVTYTTRFTNCQAILSATTQR